MAIGGLDVAGLVQQLMSVERAPAARWNQMRLAALSQSTAWSDIGAKLSALRTASEALDTTKEVATSAATTSDDKVLTATARNGAAVGSTKLHVVALASAQQFVSAGLSGPSQVVGAGRAVVSSGGGTTGLGSPTVGATLPAGRHTVTVHPPAGAVATGTTPDLTAASAGFSVTLGVDGAAPVTYTTAAPSEPYTDVQQLAAAVGKTLEGVARVSVVDGKLQVTGLTTGADKSLAFGTGAGETALGLVGADGQGKGVEASLDGGARQAVSAGTPVTLLDKNGASIAFTPTGTPVPGTVAVNVVETGAGSTLADLTSALNAAGSPVSASLVNSGAGGATPYHLTMTATGAGAAGAFTLDLSGHAGFAAVHGDPAAKRTDAVDAKLYVGGTWDAATGTGTGGLLVTRSSNTVDDLLQDVTLNLARTGEATVGVTRDQAGLTTKTKGVVDALNTLLSTLATQTRPGADGARGGPLSASSSARGIASRVFSTGSGTVPSGTMTALSQLGIQVTREGRYKLDEAALAKAVQADPEGVAGMLSSFAARVTTFAKETGGIDGPVQAGTRAASKEAKSRQTQMDTLDKRLETVERRYTSQFAKLNAAMSVLQSQQSQLSSQIASMYY